MNTQLKMLDNMIKSKQKELAQITTQKKKEIVPLIKKREELSKKIYTYMKVKNLTHYQGVTIQEVSPKVKKEKISRSTQLAKLRQMGIRNPEAALKEIGI